MNKQKTIDYCVNMALLVGIIKEEDRKLLSSLLAVAYSDGRFDGFNEAVELRKKHENMTEEQLIECERLNNKPVINSSIIL